MALDSIGDYVKFYFGLGLSLHFLIWILEVMRSYLCRRSWPDVEVENKRMSEGGEQAPHGEGQEVYDYDTSAWTCYAIFKVVFAIATGLLPVRLLLFLCFFFSAALVAAVGSRFSPGSCAFTAARFSFAVCCKGLCTSCACYASEVVGREHLKWINKPGVHPIIVPNHITFVEVFHLHWLTGGMSGVMSKGQLGVPLMKHVAKFLTVIVADPKDPNTKEKTIQGILKFVENAPNNQGRYPYAGAFTIYPEGITGSQHGLFRFNTGAFAPGKAILPCVQRFPYSHMNPGWVSKSKISAGNYGFAQIVRYMSQFTMPLQVKFLELYEPSEAECKEPVVFANNVQNLMALQLGTVTTDTSNKILREKSGPFDFRKKEKPAVEPLLV